MLSQASILKLSIKIIIVDFVMVFPSNEDHQVIVAIYQHQYTAY